MAIKASALIAANAAERTMQTLVILAQER